MSKLRLPLRTAACAWCEVEFATRLSRQIYCSRLCSNRATYKRQWDAGSKRAFRSLSRTQKVRIAARDGWRCGFCHAVIEPGLRWPHPGSLSIDHIVPVSAGGTHEPANWQAAHLACNLDAGAKRAA